MTLSEPVRHGGKYKALRKFEGITRLAENGFGALAGIGCFELHGAAFAGVCVVGTITLALTMIQFEKIIPLQALRVAAVLAGEGKSEMKFFEDLQFFPDNAIVEVTSRALQNLFGDGRWNFRDIV